MICINPKCPVPRATIHIFDMLQLRNLISMKCDSRLKSGKAELRHQQSMDVRSNAEAELQPPASLAVSLATEEAGYFSIGTFIRCLQDGVV